MNTLVLGLYAEGRTDERFLPAIIKQTVEYILRKHNRIDIEILDLMLIKTPSHCSNRAEIIRQTCTRNEPGSVTSSCFV